MSGKFLLVVLCIGWPLPLSADPPPSELKIPVWGTFQRSLNVETYGQRVRHSHEINQSLRIRTRYLDPAVNAFVGFVAGFHHFNRDILLDEPPTRDEMEWLGNMGVALGLIRGSHLWELDIMGVYAGTSLGPALALEGEHQLTKHFSLYHRTESNFFTGDTLDILFDQDQGICWNAGPLSLTVGYRIVASWQINRSGPRAGLRLRFNSPKIPFIFPSLG